MRARYVLDANSGLLVDRNGNSALAGVSEALHPTRRMVEAGLRGAYPEFAYDQIPEVGSDLGAEITYTEYLATPEWREYRAAILARQGGVCATCPRDATHCHHRSYSSLGWEADGDCVGLCPDCHARHHGKRRR